MNCWHCKTELIWQCDHDISEESENMCMVTNLHCPNCGCDVDVWYPKDNIGMPIDDGFTAPRIKENEDD
jgi:hypothetical protein